MQRLQLVAAWALMLVSLVIFTGGCGLVRGVEKVGAFAEANSAQAKELLTRLSELSSKSAEDYDKIVGLLKEWAGAAQAQIGEVRAKAAAMDTNKDGTVSMMELLIGLGSLAGGFMLRNVASNNRKTDKFSEIERKVAALDAVVTTKSSLGS